MSGRHVLPGVGKSPDQRSNFVQACNILSRYLKGKAGLRDLNLGGVEALGDKSEETLDLLSSIEKPAQDSTKREQSVVPFPRFSTVDSFLTVEDPSNKASSSKSPVVVSKTGQMTIFYEGKVLVFDDLPVERAREVMLLANRISAPQRDAFLLSNTSHGAERVEGGVSLASSSTSQPHTSSTTLQPPPEASGSDLPIARRASLHKFLEKRKDRANARAPYEPHNRASAAASKHERDFDLNL